MNDWMGLLISVVYIFGLIGLAEGLRRWRGFSSDFTRKAIHIGVGMLAWALPFLFSEPWLFILACLGFMVLNLLDWRFGFFAAMSSSSRSNLGTVYFPLAAAVVAYVFWDSPPIMVAALMPLTWGDGLAPVIGKLYGRHRYHIHTSVRTVEGSIGFFLAAFLATWLALWVMPGLPDLTPVAALLPALTVSLVTTLVEAVSIWGLDNLTITAAAMIILQFWFF
ncbi:MAG: phosphatidate cytidylyltransferase [Chloroflexi bacterium]|jgi:phytol kinase|nr:phosphatidate cytidylyltransferase [Chloroflexota bacterium]